MVSGGIGLKAVVFDMDGVLFDTESVGFAAWDYACKKLGIAPASGLAYKTLGMNAAAVDGILKEYYGENFELEAFHRLCREYTYTYFAENGVPQKPYVHDALNALKNSGFQIALASSTGKTGVLRNLESAGITDYFEVIISGDMIEKSKPEPDIYLKAAEVLGVNPDECFAVEDSKNGILSAHGAGMKVIMVPDLWQGDKETDGLLFAKCENLKAAADMILKAL